MANLQGLKHTEKRWVISDIGDIIGYMNNNGIASFFPAGRTDNALTASAVATQAGGLKLNYRISRVTTVVTLADAVTLPAAKAGMQLTVINAAAANSMNVFPAVGEIINALAANAAIAVAANKAMIFTCAVNGTWNTILTA